MSFFAFDPFEFAWIFTMCAHQRDIDIWDLALLFMHPALGGTVAHMYDVAKDANGMLSFLPPLGVDNEVDPLPLFLTDLARKVLLENQILATLIECFLHCGHHEIGPFRT